MVLADQTSWNLIGRAADGDATARQEFAHRYGPFLRRVLARRWAATPYRSHFDDAVQEVFVQCFKPGGVIDRADPNRGASVRTVLYAVARNVAWRFERADLRGPQGGDPPVELADPLDGLAELTREEARALVQDALRRLCESADPADRRYGELLRSRAYDGRTIAGLADGDPAVAARLHRDYARAKRRFEAHLAAVVTAGYPAPPDEVRAVLLELLAALA